MTDPTIEAREQELAEAAKALAHPKGTLEFVPCSICNGQPSDPVHGGGPKGHPYMVGPL